MSNPRIAPIWLNDTDVCTLDYLIEVSGLSAPELIELIDTGVMEPIAGSAEPLVFHGKYLWTVKTARRLRDDFELDRHGLALALILLQRIEALESALREAQLRRPQIPRETG